MLRAIISFLIVFGTTLLAYSQQDSIVLGDIDSSLLEASKEIEVVPGNTRHSISFPAPPTKKVAEVESTVVRLLDDITFDTANAKCDPVNAVVYSFEYDEDGMLTKMESIYESYEALPDRSINEYLKTNMFAVPIRTVEKPTTVTLAFILHIQTQNPSCDNVLENEITDDINKLPRVAQLLKRLGYVDEIFTTVVIHTNGRPIIKN